MPREATLLDVDRALDGQEHETRLRLLEAAGEVFAEKGFESATVREICQRADANVAAINYHFGSKLRLYQACFDYWLDVAYRKYPPDFGMSPSLEPREKLRVFIRAAMLRILDPGKPSWHGKLMLREMSQPTDSLNNAIDSRFKPLRDQLAQIVIDLIGTSDAAIVGPILCSIIGQVTFYHHARHVIERLMPEIDFGTVKGIEKLAERIFEFSIGGIESMAAARPTRRRRR